MKRLFPLIFVVMLLSGCPNAKLPTPSPKVPEPKTETSSINQLLQSATPVLVAARSLAAGHS